MVTISIVFLLTTLVFVELAARAPVLIEETIPAQEDAPAPSSAAIAKEHAKAA